MKYISELNVFVFGTYYKYVLSIQFFSAIIRNIAGVILDVHNLIRNGS